MSYFIKQDKNEKSENKIYIKHYRIAQQLTYAGIRLIVEIIFVVMFYKFFTSTINLISAYS